MYMKRFRSNSTAARRTKRSMQYYRLWIYSCNGVLGITSAIFAIFAAFVIADVRLSLLGGVELYHPTFLYAYTALILQCGVVQTIGCLGAQRLSHKLLSVYWILLLLLTIGDVVVGLVWVFKLDKVKLNLRPLLTREFISKYSTDESFTRTWNKVQSEEHCCGVDGPLDYDQLSRVQSQHSTNPNSSLIIDVESSLLSLPESCCIVIYDSAPVRSSSGGGDSLNKTNRSPYHPHEKEFSANASNRSNFENDHGGGNNWGDWDNRRTTNVTFNSSTYEGGGESGPHSFQYDIDTGGGGSRTYADDNNIMLNDDSQINQDDNNLLESKVLDAAEQPLDAYEQLLLASRDNINPNLHIDTFLIYNKTSKSNSDEILAPVALPLVSSSLVKLKHKNKVRHGSHHKGKVPTSQNNFSTSNTNSSFISNDTLAERDEIITDRNKNNSTGNNNNVFSGGGSEKRNKTKSLPSFSFSTTRKILKNEKSITTLVEEPEYIEKLPVPFTCQRHPKIPIHYHHQQYHHQQQKHHYTQGQSSSSTPRSISQPETGITLDVREDEKVLTTTKATTSTESESSVKDTVTAISTDDDTTLAKSSTVETNEIEDERFEDDEEENNDVAVTVEGNRIPRDEESGSSPGRDSSSSSNTEMSKNRIPRNIKQRRKRSYTSPLIPVNSEPSSVKESSSSLMLGSNLFSFLHTSAFPQEVVVEDDNENDRKGLGNSQVRKRRATRDDDDDGDDSSSVVGSGNRKGLGKMASDIQAAYYFSSSSYYNSNSYNSSLEKRFHVYRHGCGVKLIQWLDHVSGILFILGFCIIGFVKTCFLVILRTEIREMIEKIQMLELEDPVSPSRAHCKDQRLSHVSHPLLAHPHRASTVSAHAYNAALPTIKSPEGPPYPGPSRLPKGYHQRRHSNIIGDRSQSHSQETVNMTVFVTNNNNPATAPGSSTGGQTETKQTEKGRSNPNLSICGSGMMMGYGIRDDFDPTGILSISVPNTARYLRRSSTCSTSANPGPSYYPSYAHYDPDKPGPSSRFYNHDPTTSTHHHLYHQHCSHNYGTRSRPYIRNISTGAVVHQSNYASSGGVGARCSIAGGECGGLGLFRRAATTTSEAGGSTSANFRSFGRETGSGGCSFSSRDENEILSVSMDNVTVQSEAIQLQSPSEDEKEKERREAEIRDWAAATACTDNTTNSSNLIGNEDIAVGVKSSNNNGAATEPGAVSLGDYSKAGFNHSSDSAESNDRQQYSTTTRRNGNNNMDTDSIPLSYLGTAV